MAEWLYEAGIGETRAALIEGGRIVELAIETDAARLRAGSILPARIARAADAGGRAPVDLGTHGEALLIGAHGLNEGMRLVVDVVREALWEPGGGKLAQVRRAAPDAAPCDGPDLLTRLATSLPLRKVTPADGTLDALGWGEGLEEAASGLVARPEALLRISLTPAMTLIDVDGAGAPADLARHGARLAGETIRRFGIAGSIGIDLPTLADRADRQAAATALDAVLPQPFERTAVNGFGFLQIVRRRVRASLPELLAADRVGAAARALLRAGERAAGHGPVTLTAAPPVIARIEATPAWRDDLARRIGAPIGLQAEEGRAISAGHAQRRHA